VWARVATRELALDERGQPGLRRILLISDGQANEGVSDRDELAQLATGTATRAIPISMVDVGLDVDEATMRRLAEVGRGNYYFVEDTVALSAMFMRELAGLGHIVASAVELVVTRRPGCRSWRRTATRCRHPATVW
jgi:Ca-activated chloride channel family protein